MTTDQVMGFENVISLECSGAAPPCALLLGAPRHQRPTVVSHLVGCGDSDAQARVDAGVCGLVQGGSPPAIALSAPWIGAACYSAAVAKGPRSHHRRGGTYSAPAPAFMFPTHGHNSER